MVTPSTVIYTPVLKWKRGEQLAVSLLSDAQKALLLPIAELADRPYDWEEGEYTKTWDQHILDVAKSTLKFWGAAHEIAFDQLIDSDEHLESNPGTPWEYLFRQLWAHGVQAVPVISSRASKAEREALKQCTDAHRRQRWMLRFILPDDTEPDTAALSAADVVAWFIACLQELGTPSTNVDVVFDCGYVGDWDPASVAARVAAWTSGLAAAASWRSISLVSGGFPENLAGLPKGTAQIPRRDWELYQQVTKLPAVSSHALRFGDYGISHVDAFDGDPRMLQMSANLRYTHLAQWHALKGASVRNKGYGQYIDLCKLLTALPIFMGASFSNGDKNYDDIATGIIVKPGNATQWRRDATNHHIHVVLSQLKSASSTVPSGTP